MKIDYAKIAAGVPALARGLVWCTVCGRSQKVIAADCLQAGWPKCHGYTMTIDSPEERAFFTRGSGKAVAAQVSPPIREELKP